MYNRTIHVNNHKVNVEFSCTHNRLNLEHWDTLTPVPCRVEADYIELEIKEWLLDEYAENFINYQEDLLAAREESKYDRDKAGF